MKTLEFMVIDLSKAIKMAIIMITKEKELQYFIDIK